MSGFKVQIASSVFDGRFNRKRRKHMRSGNIPPNPKHLKFIRTLECALSGNLQHTCSGIVEAAHLGRRGRGQKAPDETAVPMCSSAHRTGYKAFHKGELTFFEYWKLDREMLILQYQTLGVLEGTITEVHLARLKTSL